ncbi:MAG: protein kinase [Verrucomicrobiales bacterium]|nr:protein kinase [Verrucomicrobiales bacterium]
MPESPAICPVCGAALTGNTRRFCPRCLWRQTLTSNQEKPSVDPTEVDADWLAEHGFEVADEASTDTRVFAGYRLEGELGRGGMGMVYAARQPGVNRRVALKVLLPTVSGRGGDALRFQNEVEAASRLDHPNILPVYEYGEHEGQWFYTMKFAEGGNLAEHISDFGFRSSDSPQAAGEIKESQRRIARLILQLSRALAYAHQRGILHRDLKPANILLDAAGDAFISDFGLAKFLKEDRGFTLTQGVVGTPGYMAPEQARGRKEEVTTATDVYGLGTILYELLTGRTPFQGHSTVETLQQVVAEEVRPPHQVCPQIDRDLETICLKCLAKEPSRRYPTANALAEDLERWLAGELIAARPASTVERAWRWCRRRPALAALTGVVAILAVVSTFAAIRMGLAVQEAHRESYYANISLAYEHIQEGEIQKALEMLLACPTEMRHWEWGHLMYLCHQNIAFLSLHTNIVSVDDMRPDFLKTFLQGLTFSPDSRYIAARAHDGRLGLWEVATHSRVFTAGDAAHPVGSFSFSRDGGLLATGFGGEIRIVETAFWQVSQTLETDGQSPRSLTWGRLGKQDRLAACFPDGSVRVWRLGNDDSVERIHTTVPGASSVTFTTDSKQLAVQVWQRVIMLDPDTGNTVAIRNPPTSMYTKTTLGPHGRRWVAIDPDQRVWLYEVGEEGRPLGIVLGDFPGYVGRVFFSPDGSRFCTGGEKGSARVWDAETGEELFAVPERVCHAAFSADNRVLITAGYKLKAHIWDLEVGRKVRTLAGHTEIIDQVALSPDGVYACTSSLDRTVGLWSARAGREILETGSSIMGTDYSPDGALCATAPLGRGLWLWDANTTELRAELSAARDVFWTAVFSPDGRQIATDSILHEPRVWDVKTGEILHTLRGHTRAIWPVVYNPDGRQQQIATMDYGGQVKIWDATTGRELHTLNAHLPGLGAIDFSPCGRYLATGSAREEIVRVWSVASWECVRELPGQTGGCCYLKFVPGDGRLATSAVDHGIRLWNIRTGALTQEFSLSGSTGPLRFTPDGKRMAAFVSKVGMSGFDVPRLEIWDVGSGRLALSLVGHEEHGVYAVFSRDVRRLLTGSWDHSARQWESFPWREEDYPGNRDLPFKERIDHYARDYWRSRLAAETSATRSGSARIVNHVPFDRTRIPPRSLEAGPAQLDLTARYIARLDVPFYPAFEEDYDNDLRAMSPGLVDYDGVRFDVRGVLQLRRSFPDHLTCQNYCWNQLPARTGTIPVGSRVERLHLLLGASSTVEDGTAIAALRWHYADGTSGETAIVYGQHVRNWWFDPDNPDPALTEGHVVWQGSNPTAAEEGRKVRVFHSSLGNPRPKTLANSVELVSRMTNSGLFVLAMTVE